MTFNTLLQHGLVVLVSCLLLPGNSFAADCPLSPYSGRATLNEFFKDRSNMANDPDDFVELKILDSSISSTIYDTWKIRVCEDNDPGNNNDASGCSSYIPVSNFTEDTIPWLVLKDGNIGRYVNFKTGFDAVLLDANNQVIDYLSVDSYDEVEDQLDCDIANLPYDFTASAPGASDKFIYRLPDGTGDWDSAPSASEPPTEDDSNDKDPNGDIAPIISVNNVIVNKGQTAVFTFSLEGAPKSYDVSVDYETLGGTAIAGTDYVYSSGTLTIPAGDSSATVSVNTIAASPSGIVFFYLFLDNQVNASIANAFPTGTILANVASEWYMDEAAWDGTAGEVNDIGSSGNHGTAYNNLTTDTGYLCNAGRFDGSNDYIQIPHSPGLNGTNSLTYMAWINPDTWSGGIRQVMAKSVHGGGSGRAQMGIFSESGVLKGRAETSAGRYEVSTSLPATGSWTHVALVFTGYSLELYRNGSLVDVNFFAATTLVQTTDPMTLSKRYGSNQYYFAGKIDEVIVDQAALSSSLIKSMYDNYQLGLNWDGTARSCGLLHHIQIEHDGIGLNCLPETITVKACNDAACTSLNTSDVTVDLQATDGNWSSPNPVTISGGTTTFELRDLTAGVTTLSAANPSPAASQAPAYTCINTGPNPTGNACNIEFFSSALVLDVPTQTSCATSTAINVQALATDPATSQCVPLFTGSKTLKAWTSYLAPVAGDMLGSPALDLTNNLTTPATVSLPATGAAPATDNISLLFDGSGNANFTISYPDAGQLQLNLRYDGTGSEAGLVLLGNDDFVIMPHHLNVYSDNANASCASNDGNCSAFRRAGNSSDPLNQFDLKIDAACQDQSITPNFRLDNIAISANLVAPVGGNNASISVSSFNMSKADSGQHIINNQTVSEVGVFSFTATPPLNGYLGETVPAATSDSIGRFYPAYFDTAATNACGSFTYSGQPFLVDILAYNSNDVLTENYRDSFVQDPLVSDAGDSANFTNNIFTQGHFSAGAGQRTDVTYTYPAKDTPESTLNIRATDSDSVTSQSHTEGSIVIRSGRAVLDNAYGPEPYPLVMPLRFEYYSSGGAGGYVINSDDSCSTYSASGAGTHFANFTQNLAAAEIASSGSGQAIAGLYDSATPNPVLLHLPGNTTQGPGVGNHGSVNFILNNISDWLKYNWNYDCDNADGDNNITTGIDAGLCGPYANASFGL
ncbi:MAG: Calx-beta domain-containing protein, partial [Thioalkalispiraceae bacterium]